MISDKISDIVSMLIETTNSGDLVWDIKKHNGFTMPLKENSYNNERSLTSASEDGLSEFEISVKFTIQNDRWVIESSCGLWVRNKDLPNGQMYLVSNTYPSIITLRNTLKDKFCSDLNPTTDLVEDKLSDILKGISKSTFRNNILTKVFNGKGDK